MENSINAIQQKYSNCNLLMPMSTETQLNPFYKLTVSSVTADVSENSGDIFKVGTSKVTGPNGKDIWVDVFSPAKPLLMKLAAAAGIQFDPSNTYGEYISRNCYKAKAYGALKMPDGTGKTHCDEKVINLDDEEDRFRMEFMDKSIQGIVDDKAAKEAEKMFPGGEWKETVNKFGKPCKAYVVPEKDRQTYIDRSVMVNMMLLRKTFAEKAMTGAILRVVRALIGLKGTYTLEELKKPFAVSRVTFSPDYSDPEVRAAMLSQGMNSMGNMFGTSAVPALTADVPHRDRLEFNPEEYADNAAFVSDVEENPADDFANVGFDASQAHAFPDEEPQQNAPQNAPTGQTGNICADCGREVSAAVAQYSNDNFGKVLCMSCQKKGV